MYDVAVGMSDYHFGNNVYFAPGTYTITATINGQTATFNSVQVGAMSAMPMGSQPTTLPQSGDAPVGWSMLIFIGGLALLAGGLALRFRTAVLGVEVDTHKSQASN